MMYYRPAHQRNFKKANRKKSDIKYIVIHYTAGKGDTARNNVDAFTHLITKTSAHFFVDEKEVAMSVDPVNIAWHCGGKKYANGAPAPFHGKCTNSNSIGVEMCSDLCGNQYVITADTQSRAAKFTAELMIEYNIPIERVVRHYDVTGKYCPMPMVDSRAWGAFLNMVKTYYKVLTTPQPEKKEELMEYYEKLTEIPAGELRAVVEKLVDLGIVKGTGDGLHLSPDMVRTLVFQDRMIKKALAGEYTYRVGRKCARREGCFSARRCWWVLLWRCSLCLSPTS